MSTDITAVEEGVQRIVATVLRTAPGQDAPDLDTDLWSAGLDSMGSVSLMVGLEDEFGIEFPDSMLDRETFSSVPFSMATEKNRVTAKIAKKIEIGHIAVTADGSSLSTNTPMR